MARIRSFLACLAVALPAIGFDSAVAAGLGGSTQLAQSTTGEWRPSFAQASEIQARLKELGFDPGRPDGNIGPRTLAAIRAYQASIGVPADGAVTPELYERLMTAENNSTEGEGAPFATAAPVPPEPQPEPQPPKDCSLRTTQLWHFEDSIGSSFQLSLREDGTVEGPTYPDHWRWEPKDQGIEIVYDNGMGLRVTRVGKVQDGKLMVGEATDSRGHIWNWSAERTVLPAGDCQLGSRTP